MMPQSNTSMGMKSLEMEDTDLTSSRGQRGIKIAVAIAIGLTVAIGIELTQSSNGTLVNIQGDAI